VPSQTPNSHPSIPVHVSSLPMAEQPTQSMQGKDGMAMPHEQSNQMFEPKTLLGGVVLLVGLALVAGVMLRRKRVDQDTAQTAKGSRLSSKNVLALGVFAVFIGGTLTVTSLFKPSSSMGNMEGMEGMSMEEMMRVDGSSNPIPVTVEAVKPGLIEASVRYTGTIRPYQEVTVYPRVQGQLTEYSVYPGDQVAKGQPLARLSAAELTSDVEEAIAETRTSQAELQASRAGISEQQKEIERMAADYTYWQKELPRAKALLQKGVISQDEFDKEKSQADAALAAVKGARSKLDRMQAEIASSAAKVAQARVKTRRAAILENYKDITAPITGIVQERLIDPGVFVQPGMGILKIGDYSRVRLQANVAQQDAVNIQVGSPIRARISGKSTDVMKGRVTSIFPKTGEETRTVTVEAVVDNPSERLRAGQFLEISIVTDRKPATLSVPQAAVAQFNGKPAVWVIAGDVAQHREISTGMTSGDRIEVTDGLKPGDQVITSGQQRLADNARVAVVDATGKPVASLNNTNQGNVRIQLISPKDKAVMGDNQLILEVQDPSTGKPMPVKDLEVGAAMQMKNMAPMQGDVAVKPDSQLGRFKVNAYFGMRGSWQVNAKVKDGDRQGQATFNLETR
jgi:multidrug efflux pump subunit AcrA (membrane-fusion protein)